ncbi:hypothetical protein EK21DRAFT_116493 [Setomelanomma holmii]|uniref:Uncharacterized protein n=1 Tax=Setomelanomma holmii TaxID=210430 RepID=A0A9P4LGL3_9PLEO|nr:hypothetical protein EK21DRAFT_116493 [Setomelanomma holmii]
MALFTYIARAVGLAGPEPEPEPDTALLAPNDSDFVDLGRSDVVPVAPLLEPDDSDFINVPIDSSEEVAFRVDNVKVKEPKSVDILVGIFLARPFDGMEQVLQDGFSILLQCHVTLANSERSLAESCAACMRSLRDIRPAFAVAFFKVISLLSTCTKWPLYDAHMVDKEQAYSISGVVRILIAGPMAYLNRPGRMEKRMDDFGKAWVANHSKDDQEALVCFVGEFRLWSQKVYLRHIDKTALAKRSTVKKVEPTATET